MLYSKELVSIISAIVFLAAFLYAWIAWMNYKLSGRMPRSAVAENAE